MTDRVFVRCCTCGRVVPGRVPKGGDGTARLPYKHKTRDGRVCDGHLYEAEWVDEPRNKGWKMNRKTDAERQALWDSIWTAMFNWPRDPPDRLTDADLYGIARLLGVEFEGEETSQKMAELS